MSRLRAFRAAAITLAPTALAVLTAGAGMMLLAGGATPSDPQRVVWLTRFAPELLIEVSHFACSILGLVLVLLAFGLSRRLDAAWAATAMILPPTAVLTLAKGVNWEEAAILVALLVVVAPFHEAFPRRARLTRMEITPGWLASAMAGLVGAGLLGWWAFEHASWGDAPFWRVVADHDAARALRSSAGAAILLLLVGIWRLIATPATPPVIGEDDPDFTRVRTILKTAKTAEPAANLALLGDKRFLFSPSGKTFLMFGVRGRSWIAVGPPVGLAAERLELLWRFRELADAHAARPGLYGLSPDDLPDAVELGFSIQKVGESAIVALDGFSLAGSRRGDVRRNWRRAGEEGAVFEVVEPSAVPGVMADLKRISDNWLSRQGSGEKAFTLGGFEERYVAEFPVGLVRAQGRIVAFATLWVTAGKGAFSIDLMRFAADAPPKVMDFLFVELIQWGRAAGYEAFDFGMAPLAGLEDRPLAPLLSRVGRLLFETGEEIYNFRGVRKFKDKYDPSWRPNYIAAPHRWQAPILLADVGLLSSRGVAGLARRPKRDDGTPATGGRAAA